MFRHRKKISGDPKPLSEIIEGEFCSLGGPPPVPLEIAQAWTPSVGERVARRARPARLKGKTLFIKVTTSAWMNELQMLAPTILARLEERKTGRTIETLRFELGALPRQHTQPPPPRKHPPIKIVRTKPSAPLPENIEQALDQIEDPDLRRYILDALSSVLKP